MKYSELRTVAKTGGVIMVEGKSLVSRIIRMATGQNVSHVAVLFWMGDNLFMAEMREFRGYVLSRASDRLQNDMRNCHLYYGEPPDEVANCNDLTEAIFKARNKKYGYASLLKILTSQFKKKDDVVEQLVCSTYIASVWRHSGYVLENNPDPGDYMRLCKTVSPLDLQEFYK